MGIKLLISVIPGILYMSCGFWMLFYAIDSRLIATMKKDLEERRQEAAASPASG